MLCSIQLRNAAIKYLAVSLLFFGILFSQNIFLKSSTGAVLRSSWNYSIILKFTLDSGIWVRVTEHDGGVITIRKGNILYELLPSVNQGGQGVDIQVFRKAKNANVYEATKAVITKIQGLQLRRPSKFIYDDLSVAIELEGIEQTASLCGDTNSMNSLSRVSDRRKSRDRPTNRNNNANRNKNDRGNKNTQPSPSGLGEADSCCMTCGGMDFCGCYVVASCGSCCAGSCC